MVAHVPVLEHPKELLLLLLDRTIICESGAENNFIFSVYYLDDPLWDGSDCFSGNNWCSNINLPWLQYQLNQTTKDDIEVRICRNEGFDNEGVLT